MTQTKILVFNGNSNAEQAMEEWIEKHDPDLAYIVETGNLKPVYRKQGQLFYSEDDIPTDPSVLARRKGKYRSRAGMLTNRVHRTEKPQMWRDRWYVQVRDLKRREVNIVTHANAIIHDDGRWRDNAGAVMWRSKGLPHLARVIKRAQRWKRKVRVGGDFNFPHSTVPMSPNEFFGNLGMAYVSKNLMWLAYDPSHERLVSFKTLGVAPGADAHHALLVVLEDR